MALALYPCSKNYSWGYFFPPRLKYFGNVPSFRVQLFFVLYPLSRVQLFLMMYLFSRVNLWNLIIWKMTLMFLLVPWFKGLHVVTHAIIHLKMHIFSSHMQGYYHLTWCENTMLVSMHIWTTIFLFCTLQSLETRVYITQSIQRVTPCSKSTHFVYEIILHETYFFIVT